MNPNNQPFDQDPFFQAKAMELLKRLMNQESGNGSPERNQYNNKEINIVTYTK